MDGTADGIITAKLLNWNCLAVKIPRAEIQEYTHDDLYGAGVYFLFCGDDNGSESVYIGESENVLSRLRQHMRDFQAGSEKFFWHTALVFTSGDINKTFVRYLEYRLVKDARDCRRYTVLTKNTHSRTVIQESEKAFLAEFMDNMKLTAAMMSCKVFEPLPHSDRVYLFCGSKESGAEAKSFMSSGSFTVMKDSRGSLEIAQSLVKVQHKCYVLRLRLESEGVISRRIFTRDYVQVSD